MATTNENVNSVSKDSSVVEVPIPDSQFGAIMLSEMKTEKLSGQANYKNWMNDVKYWALTNGLDLLLKSEASSNPEIYRQQVRIMSKLMQSMEFNLVLLFEDCQTPKEVLDKLEKRYEVSSQVKLTRVINEWTTMAIWHNEPMAEYIVRFETATKEVRNCGGEIGEPVVCARLLNSLGPKYTQISNRLVSESSLEIIMEKLRNECFLQSVDNKVLAVTKVCYNCRRKGHLAKECSANIGKVQRPQCNDFGASYGRPQCNDFGAQSAGCTRCCLCGGAGHSSIECRENMKRCASTNWKIDSGATAHFCVENVLKGVKCGLRNGSGESNFDKHAVCMSVGLASGSYEQEISRMRGQALARRYACFSCGRQGHVSRDCGKCFVCERTGHKAVNCPQRWRDESSWRSNQQSADAWPSWKRRNVEGCWRMDDSGAANRNGTVHVENGRPVTSRALTAIGNVEVTSGEGLYVPKDVPSVSVFGKAKDDVVADKTYRKLDAETRSYGKDNHAVCMAVEQASNEGRYDPRDMASVSGCGKAKADLVDKRRVKLVTKGRSQEKDDLAVWKATSEQLRAKHGDFGFNKLCKRTVELYNAEGWRSSNIAESDVLTQKGGCDVDHVIRKQTSTRKMDKGANKVRFKDNGECSNWIANVEPELDPIPVL